MLIYILKSAACLAILFVFYKLLLEKESVHRFKRFYLLGALVFSLIVPALVFTEYIVVEPPVEMNYDFTQGQPVSEDLIHFQPALEADIIDIAPVLWSIYFLGLFFFGIKFVRNLFQILNRVRKNPKQKLNRFTQVLLQEKITPHTFFSYIFLNKTKFESKQIPKEVLLHEQTHARQKHSWDVVFVELLQVIFWMNPFIYLTKKSIKLNHEFLADQAVLQKNVDETTYKNTLLSYLSPDSEKKYQSMANAINYSSIKKRFTIMKTQTSKKAILLRSLLLLPLLAILILGFSETKLLEREAVPPSITVRIDIKNNTEIWLKGKPIKLENIASRILEITTNKENGAILKIEIATPEALRSEFLSQLDKELMKVQPATITVFSDEHVMPENEYKKEIDFDSATIKLTTNKVTTVSPLENATPKQIAQYNNLAKKYNTMLVESKRIQIKKQDVDRLEYIYSLMSEKQKTDAEPFPDFPEPPTPPKAPRPIKGEASSVTPTSLNYRNSENNIQKQKTDYSDRITLYRGKENDIIALNVAKPPKPPHLENLEIESSIQNVKEGIQSVKDLNGEVDFEIPSPTTPPEPPSTLDHIIEMAKEGAIFKYKGKTISSDKAIDLIRKNKDLSISTKKKNNERPIVKISKYL